MIKPVKTVVQQPLTLNGKFVKYKIHGDMQYVHVKAGDTVLTEKRPGLNVSLNRMKKATVATVYFSTFERANIVELEPKDFKTVEHLNKY